MQFCIERDEREVEFGGAQRERERERESVAHRNDSVKHSITLYFNSYFLRSHHSSLATAMPSRRRTLLKVIILGDSGFVSSSFPFLGFLFTQISSFFALFNLFLVSPFDNFVMLFHFTSDWFILWNFSCSCLDHNNRCFRYLNLFRICNCA